MNDADALELESSHELSRFLFRGEYGTRRVESRDVRYVKPVAFIPPPTPPRALSVFFVGGLAEAEVWEIGAQHVAPTRNKSIKGCAVFLVADVVEAELSLDPNNTPPRHVDITGWPSEESVVLLRAKLLADAASLRLLEDPGSISAG